MTTRVVNFRDAPRGWIGDPSYAYVGRERWDQRYEEAERGFDGRFGNIFVLHHEAHRDKVVALHRRWFLKKVVDDPEYRARVLSLRGKTLVCWCAPRACHADVIKEWLDEGESDA